MIKSPQGFITAKENKQLLSLVTCYDYSFAKILAKTDISAILIGDSLGNVIQGERTTLKVQPQDIIYHSRAVRKALPDHFIIADMPFMCAHIGQEHCLSVAREIIQKGEVNAVKIEGTSAMPQIQALINSGVPVMGHVGLEPQKILHFGKYRKQGQELERREALVDASKSLEQAGCFAIILELIPPELALRIDQSITIPTIGIGAGPHTSGQILVLHDLLGFSEPKSFVKTYANLQQTVFDAVQNYCTEVKSRTFPQIK